MGDLAGQTMTVRSNPTSMGLTHMAQSEHLRVRSSGSSCTEGYAALADHALLA